MVPIILDPVELRAEVVKLVEDHDAKGVLKPWLDADVEVSKNIICCRIFHSIYFPAQYCRTFEKVPNLENECLTISD